MNANRISLAFWISTLTLGLSCWAVACSSAGTPAPGPSPLPSACVPVVAAPETARVAMPQPAAVVSAPASATAGRASGAVLPNAQLSIKRVVLAREIKGREPAVALTQVAAGSEPLFAFVELENRSSEDGAIVITFEKKGIRTGNIELTVPANQNRWRTWGWTRGVREAGQWSVVVRSAGGRELARTAFEAT